jgi:Ca-activated chloride channel family protein
MTFRNGQLLYWTAFALFAGLAWLYWQVRRSAADRRRFLPQLPDRARGPIGRAWLIPAAAVAVLLALAGPSWGDEVEVVYTSGLDIYFVLDCSYSMTARDVPPSRLKAASFLALSLIKELPGARTGLIAFAGGAFPVCPITADAEVIRRLLAQIGPDVLNRQGTNFDAPLVALSRMIAKRERGRQLAVVFLSDGESFKSPSPQAVAALRRAAASMIVVGIGTADGAFIEDPRTRFQTWIKDKDGRYVRSRLQEAPLTALAQALDGDYHRLETVGITARRVLSENLKNRMTGTFGKARRPRDRSMQAGWLALLAIGAFLLLHHREFRPLKPGAAGVAAAAVFLLAGLAGCRGGGGAAAGLLERGNELYRSGDYERAADVYRTCLEQSAPGGETHALALVNLSAALALSGQLDPAAGMLEKGVRRAGDGPRGGDLYFNLGCCRHLQHRRDPAAAAYRQALERSPADFGARWNLELLLRQPAPPAPPAAQPPPPDESLDRLLDSLRDQEQTRLPQTRSRPLDTGGPYW